MPVTTAKVKNTAGTYNNQCTIAKPVSQIPSQIMLPENKKKNLMELLILYFVMATYPFMKANNIYEVLVK